MIRLLKQLFGKKTTINLEEWDEIDVEKLDPSKKYRWDDWKFHNRCNDFGNISECSDKGLPCPKCGYYKIKVRSLDTEYLTYSWIVARKRFVLKKINLEAFHKFAYPDCNQELSEFDGWEVRPH
jgi:hypothetical protein